LREQGDKHELRVNVDADWAVEWLKTLRVPPYEDALPVSTWAEACGVCELHQRQVRTVTVFHGGYRMRCDTCRSEWLVLEEPQAR
jgi:predicted SprT family Zn-dependent metalloprotease